MSCKCAIETDQWHGWECDITGGACMYLSPDSKQCAIDFNEGPDAVFPDEVQDAYKDIGYNEDDIEFLNEVMENKGVIE